MTRRGGDTIEIPIPRALLRRWGLPATLVASTLTGGGAVHGLTSSQLDTRIKAAVSEELAPFKAQRAADRETWIAQRATDREAYDKRVAAEELRAQRIEAILERLDRVSRHQGDLLCVMCQGSRAGRVRPATCAAICSDSAPR